MSVSASRCRAFARVASAASRAWIAPGPACAAAPAAVCSQQPERGGDRDGPRDPGNPEARVVGLVAPDQQPPPTRRARRRSATADATPARARDDFRADLLQLVVAVGQERDQPEPENVGHDHGRAGGDGKRDCDQDAGDEGRDHGPPG